MEPTRKGIARHTQLRRSGRLPGSRCGRPSQATPHSGGEDAALQGRRRKHLRFHAHQHLQQRSFLLERSLGPLCGDDQRYRGKWSPSPCVWRERLWRDGFRYSKCGVMITELLPENDPAAGPLGRTGPGSQGTGLEGDGQLTPPSGAIPSGSSELGPKDAAWKLRAEHRSPRWTTRWDELPRVHQIDNV